MGVMMGGMDPSIFSKMAGGDFGNMGDMFKAGKENQEEPKKEKSPPKRAPSPPKKEEKKKEAPKQASKSGDPADILKDEGNVFYKNK